MISSNTKYKGHSKRHVPEAFKKKRAGGLGTEISTCMSQVLALVVEALVSLRHKVVNGCLVKFPGLRFEPVPHVQLDVVVRGESFALQSLFVGDQTWRNLRERGLDCMEGDREPPTPLIICSAMPGKGMSFWHEWWLEMSIGVITSNQNRNDKVSIGRIPEGDREPPT